MNISQTQLTNYAKMITGVVMVVLPLFGIVADQNQVTFIIFGILVVGFSIWSFVQRFKKGDLSLGGARK